MGRQDFDIHIHPIFCGHESLTEEDILGYINKTGRSVVVTPHFELNEWGCIDYGNYPFNDKVLRDEQLHLYKRLSRENSKVILGGEFTVQTMLDFKGSELLDDIKVKILSYHDMFKFNKHYRLANGDIDMVTTLANRDKQPWYYTGRCSVEELLNKLELCLSTFKIDVLGHMEREIDHMLHEGASLDDCNKLLDGSLDLAKKYGVVVEVNIAKGKSSKESKVDLINKCKVRGLKMVVGLDAHTVDHLYNKDDYNEYIQLIGDTNLVTLGELLYDN